MGSAGAPLLPALRRAESEGSPDLGVKGAWVICRIKRLDPGRREGAKVSHTNEEGFLLRGFQGPSFPWRVWLCLYLQANKG